MNPSSHNCYGDILITKRTLLKRTNQSKSERARNSWKFERTQMKMKQKQNLFHILLERDLVNDNKI